jgi:hypothetical protein
LKGLKQGSQRFGGFIKKDSNILENVSNPACVSKTQQVFRRVETFLNGFTHCSQRLTLSKSGFEKDKKGSNILERFQTLPGLFRTPSFFRV